MKPESFNHKIEIGITTYSLNSSWQTNYFKEVLSEISPLGGRILSQNISELKQHTSWIWGSRYQYAAGLTLLVQYAQPEL